MSSYPDFSSQGYQVITELGRNREGGRITWLATDLNKFQQVVLKQFCFAQIGSNWSAYNAHEREIQVLQELNHPGIPRYLGAFETEDGFCLIQEYKNASTLAEPRSFQPEEIKQIAVKGLEILVYLQNRIPPVIHRDIKPENILVDDQLNVYLIDFGMSCFGSQEVSGSSVFKGTPGFIPPEQMRQPTLASDLYGLGATLICLLTGTKSTAIQNLTDNDDPYLINFRHLLPRLSLRFLNWLELMVQPSLKKRFTNAQTALEALKPLDVIRVPGVELSQSVLEFQATRLGERLTQTITVENPIPDTVLAGTWEVAPHLQDPPHTPNAHTWISVEPTKFTRDRTVCHIHVDSSKLMADKLYKRQLLLHTNAYPEIYPMTVRVQTAPLPIEKRKLPYAGLAALLSASAIASVFTTYFILPILYTKFMSLIAGIVAVWVVLIAWARMTNSFEAAEILVTVVIDVVSVALFIAVTRAVALAFAWALGDDIGIFVVIIAGSIAFTYAPFRLCMEFSEYSDTPKYTQDVSTAVLFLLTLALGTSIGIGSLVGFLDPYILSALAMTGLPLVTMLLYPPLRRRQLIAKYRQSEERLIKP
ncbi:serine/threonine-protein kinase [Fischerella sp. JS2]|uniref:serine/threonine protein kinase n=1 Tax=Fischerella sp. JS2 TaxID=2597771 RepID=UPI0028F01182|nr:serine/threonine-protein kinase [Fischerella sp. JS2]